MGTFRGVRLHGIGNGHAARPEFALRIGRMIGCQGDARVELIRRKGIPAIISGFQHHDGTARI